jgi:hypothetical protein
MASAPLVQVGVTGHQALPAPTTTFVKRALRSRLSSLQAVVGITSLAAGADQLFARTVLDVGGRLVAIIPSADYENSFESEADRHSFRQLLAQAQERVVLPFSTHGEEAYWAAGREIVRRCDRLLAVWDGKPAAGLGGTADVVGYARELGKSVEIIWPPGATRT